MKRFKTRGDVHKAVRLRKVIPAFLLAICTFSITAQVSAAEHIVNGSFETPDLNDTTLFPAGSRAAVLDWTTFFGQNYQPSPAGPGPCSTSAFPVECNGDLLIDGWSVLWTDTLLMDDPANPGNLIPNPNPEPGRIEIQHNDITIRIPHVSPAKFSNQKAELDSHDRVDPTTGATVDNSNTSLFQNFPVCPQTPHRLTYWWKSRTTIPGDNDVRVVLDDAVVRVHMLTDSWQQETIDFVTDASGTSGVAFVSIGTGETHGMSLDGVSVIGPALDNCPPPPGSCEECDTDPLADVPGTTLGHDDDDHHVEGSPIGCECIPVEPTVTRSGRVIEPECGLCAGKGGFDNLTLLYDGNNTTTGSQGDGKWSVTPETIPLGGFPPTANIVVSEDKDGGVVLFSGSVKTGETFVFAPVKNALKVEIFDGLLLVQTVRFHASCSQPLEKLDSFGGITIWDGVRKP